MTTITRDISAFTTRHRPQQDPWGSFSIVRAVSLMATPAADLAADPTMRAALAGANFLRGGPDRGIGVPVAVLARDLTTTTDAGGWTIGSPAIDHANAPRGFSVTMDAGAQLVPVPRDTPAVPFVSGTSTAAWLANEGDAVGESDLTIDQRATAPKCVGFRMNLSRRLLKQGGAPAEEMVRRQMLDDLGRALDAAVLAGSGSSGQPVGVGTIGGTVSIAGTALSYATILDGVRQVLAAGARMADLAFILGAQTWETLSARERFSGAGAIIDGATIAGVPCFVSTDAAADSLYLGPWNSLTIYQWGPVEVFANPFVSPQTGSVQLRVMADVDIVIPFPGLFLKSSSIT